MSTEKRISVRLDPQTHLRFKLATVRQGLEMSNVVRTLVDEWLDDNDPIRRHNETPAVPPRNTLRG